MPQITVYSKCPVSVNMSLFEIKNAVDPQGMKVSIAQPKATVKILGVNEYKKEVFKSLVVPCSLGETQVDKDLWDKIVEQRGQGDPLLQNGQIFTAKSREEAQLKAMEAPKFITDFGGEEFYKRKSAPVTRAV